MCPCMPFFVWRVAGNTALLSFRLWSKGFHSPYGRAAYFLCSCRESRQRDTPQNIAPFGHPAQRVRDSGRVPLTALPCAGNGMRAIPRAHPTGLFVRCRRNVMATWEEPERAHPARRSSVIGARFLAPGSALDLALALALDLRVPVSRGESRTETSAGSRAGCARVRCTHTEVRSTNPGMSSRTAAGGAAPGVCSLWLLSLAQARESDPRAGRARKIERTRSEKIKNQSKELDDQPYGC
jgi:hypothetical protein